MLKKPSDFSSRREYMSYTKTSDFLLNYSWENKSIETIIFEMALPEFEQIYLGEALDELKGGNDFTGMTLDRFILRKLDEEEKDDFDVEGIVFLERDD